MHDWLRDHGLLIANLALFVIFFGGMILSGVRVYNSGSSESKPVDEQASGRGPPGCGQPSGSAVASPPRRLGLDGLRTLVVGPVLHLVLLRMGLGLPAAAGITRVKACRRATSRDGSLSGV
jgi:hypothetical protein